MTENYQHWFSSSVVKRQQKVLQNLHQIDSLARNVLKKLCNLKNLKKHYKTAISEFRKV